MKAVIVMPAVLLQNLLLSQSKAEDQWPNDEEETNDAKLFPVQDDTGKCGDQVWRPSVDPNASPEVNPEAEQNGARLLGHKPTVIW